MDYSGKNHSVFYKDYLQPPKRPLGVSAANQNRYKHLVHDNCTNHQIQLKGMYVDRCVLFCRTDRFI